MKDLLIFRILVLVLVLLFIFSRVFTQDENVYKASDGSISFESDAPLELISASSNKLKGILDVATGEFAFIVSNASFEGFNSPLQQEHFYENYIEISEFPNSSFHGKIIEPIETENNGEQQVRAKGILNIHGVEQERIINSTLHFHDGSASIISTFTILLKDHNIAIPSVVSQKIAEVIYIEVSIDLISGNP